jgi:hypothetical protein
LRAGAAYRRRLGRKSLDAADPHRPTAHAQGLMKVSYEYVTTTRPGVWKYKPEEFADASFVAELDKSGFIKKLYEK